MILRTTIHELEQAKVAIGHKIITGTRLQMVAITNLKVRMMKKNIYLIDLGFKGVNVKVDVIKNKFKI